MLTMLALQETSHTPAAILGPLGVGSKTWAVEGKGVVDAPRFEDSPSTRRQADIGEEEKGIKGSLDPRCPMLTTLGSKALGYDGSSPLGSEQTLLPLSSGGNFVVLP